MHLAGPTIQVARCEQCDGLPVGISAKVGGGSFSLHAGLYTDYAYTDFDTHAINAAHWYTSGTITDDAGVDKSLAYNYDTGHFSDPDYHGAVGVRDPGGEYTGAFAKALSMATAAVGAATETSLGSGVGCSTFGVGNVTALSGGNHFNKYTGDDAIFQEVSIGLAHAVTLRADLAFPHIRGTYETSYRLKRKKVRTVVPFGTGTTPVDNRSITYDDPVTLTATPTAGDMHVEFTAFDLPQPFPGETISVVGPAGPIPFTAGFAIIGGQAQKRGFLQYTAAPDTPGVRRVYRTETASGAGFSGHQTITVDPDSDEPRTVTFSDSVPLGLIAPSFPQGDGLYDDSTGGARLLDQSATVSDYQVPSAPEGQQALTLTLSDEYTTAALQSEIDAAISAGFDTGGGGFAGADFEVQRYLSPGETYYARYSGRLYLSAGLPSFNPLVFDDDASLEFSVLWDKVVTNLDTGEVTRTTESWFVSLSRDEDTKSEHRDYPAPSSNQMIRLKNFRTDPETDDRIEGAIVATVTG